LKVAELEQDLVTAGVDLRTANKQFSEVTNKLQEVTDEVTRLWVANSKLVQDVDGEWASNASSYEFLSFHWFLSMLICLLVVSGMCMYRVTMTVNLTEKTQEVNTTDHKILEKDDSIQRLSEQL
jgi:hypothetical protein